MVNPTFRLVEAYKALLDQAYSADGTTRAIFVVPDRPIKPWFKELLADDHWHLVAHVPSTMPIFTSVNK